MAEGTDGSRVPVREDIPMYHGQPDDYLEQEHCSDEKDVGRTERQAHLLQQHARECLDLMKTVSQEADDFAQVISELEQPPTRQDHRSAVGAPDATLPFLVVLRDQEGREVDSAVVASRPHVILGKAVPGTTVDLPAEGATRFNVDFVRHPLPHETGTAQYYEAIWLPCSDLEHSLSVLSKNEVRWEAKTDEKTGLWDIAYRLDDGDILDIGNELRRLAFHRSVSSLTVDPAIDAVSPNGCGLTALLEAKSALDFRCCGRTTRKAVLFDRALRIEFALGRDVAAGNLGYCRSPVEGSLAIVRTDVGLSLCSTDLFMGPSFEESAPLIDQLVWEEECGVYQPPDERRIATLTLKRQTLPPVTGL